MPRKVEGTLALNLLCLGNDRVLSFKTNPYVNEEKLAKQLVGTIVQIGRQELGS